METDFRSTNLHKVHEADDDHQSYTLVPVTREKACIPVLESLTSRLGRNLCDQQDQLLHAYHRLKGRQTAEFILISGPCGSGKMQLAKSLCPVVQDNGGMLLTGKFDQLRKPEPYRALVGAFTEFSSRIANDPSKLSAMRQAILEAVGDGAGVLTDMIPALERVIGHRERPTMNKGGAIGSFVFLVRTLVKTVCSDEHPVVFVMEDLQWADLCSLDLLTALLMDVESKGAVFIGTCEDNIPSDSPLSTVLRKMEDVCNVKITNIQVGDFSKDEVQDILLHELQLPWDQSSELADVMFAQTHGNLFYLTEFIQWLEEANLLKYDHNLKSWMLDRQELSLTIKCGSVGDFMVDKFEQLPRNTQEVLKIASFLGSVDEELVQVLLDFDVKPSLVVAAEHGLLVTDQHRQTYAFAHDATQKAAYALVPLETRNAFHLMIGRKMLQRLGQHKVDKNIFTLASQFCLSANLIQENQEKEAVAGLCLEAGRKAAKSSTFGTAVVYFNFGIQLLGSGCWKEHYGLALELYNAAAEMALYNYNYDRMEELLNSIFKNVDNFRDKLQAYATRIYSLGVRDQQQQAIIEGKEVLQQLGEVFPERLSRSRLLRKMASIKAMLRGKSDPMLMRLPPMEDPNKLATVQILDLMFLSSLLARPTFVPFIVLKTMKVTLQGGLSPWAANSFATYGMLCCTMGNVDEAYRFGQLALQLLERTQRREFLPRVYAAVYGCIHCWKRPIMEALEPLRLAHRVGIETGDFEFSFLNANLFCLNSIEAGEPLARVEKNVKSFCDLMATRKQETLLQLAKVFLQTIHHLMGFTNDPLALSGDILDFGDAFNHATSTSNTSLATTILLERTLLAYVFNAYDLANEIADQWRDNIFNIPPGAGIFTACYFVGLVSLAMARRCRKERRKHLRVAESNINRFRKWAGDSPHNCLDKLFLLEAERASILGQHKLAYEKYACANALAADSGCLWTQAIANERAGEHLVARGEHDVAKIYFGRACGLWEQWGALAKAQKLKEDSASNHLLTG